MTFRSFNFVGGEDGGGGGSGDGGDGMLSSPSSVSDVQSWNANCMDDRLKKESRNNISEMMQNEKRRSGKITAPRQNRWHFVMLSFPFHGWPMCFGCANAHKNRHKTSQQRAVPQRSWLTIQMCVCVELALVPFYFISSSSFFTCSHVHCTAITEKKDPISGEFTLSGVVVSGVCGEQRSNGKSSVLVTFNINVYKFLPIRCLTQSLYTVTST